jgi:hypothetical protein
VDPDERTLPLFPLHVVLFPDMPLPLHIFEPRYRLMLGRCLAEGQPFGVVLIRAGRDVGAPATPYSVGTTAAILHHQRLPDGRYQILTVGRARFRVRDLDRRQPYLSGAVEPLPEPDPPPGAAELAAQLRAEARAFLAATAVSPSSSLPSDPVALSYALPPLLGLPLHEQQALLETLAVGARLERLRALLTRERHLGPHVGPTLPVTPSTAGWPSPN